MKRRDLLVTPLALGGFAASAWAQGQSKGGPRIAMVSWRGETDVDVDFRLGATLYAALMRWLWRPLSRDITLVHQQLRASSRAFWLDEESGASVVPAESDMQRAVAAVRGLFSQP